MTMKKSTMTALLLAAALLLATVSSVPASEFCFSDCSGDIGKAIPGCISEAGWNEPCVDSMEYAAKSCLDNCAAKPANCEKACSDLYQDNIWKCADEAHKRAISIGACGDAVRNIWKYCKDQLCK